MGAPTPNSVGFSDAIGALPLGINSGVAPTLLSPAQAAFGVNVTFRGGYPHNRPPWRKLNVSYPTVPMQVAATQSIFQGAAFYSSYGNNPSCLVASIGGHIYRYTINGRDVQVQEITPFRVDDPTVRDYNNPTLDQAWLSQGQDFLLISDGQSQNLVFDGAACTRLSGPTQLPVCRQSHYCNGRFIIALPPNGGGPARGYIASDLVYNTGSGTPIYNYRDSILYIKDNQEILGGAQFAVPLSSGPITALFSVAIADTSLGQGPLQVATTGGIFSVNLPLDATLWTTTQQPSQVVTLPNGGVTGQTAVTTVNGDAWYRAYDGIRSFVTARRDFNTWVQTPMSQELDRILPYDTQALLEHASAVHFNNRLLCTCSPYDTGNVGIAHRGIVALDFNNISSLTTRSQPAWEGLWTGQPVLQLVTGNLNGQQRCFAFCLDNEGFICLYEIGLDGASYFDHDGSEDVPTQCWFESAVQLGREGDPRYSVLKRLVEGQLWLAQLAGADDGELPMSVTFISDQLPCWQDWANWTLCAPMCAPQVGCAAPTPTQPQYATYLRLPQPPDNCNAVTGRPFRTGYNFQMRLLWVGYAELRRWINYATPQPEGAPAPVCNTVTQECQLLQCCPTDPFTYSIESESECSIVITVQPHVTIPGGGVIEWDVVSDQPTMDTPTSSTITSLDV